MNREIIVGAGPLAPLLDAGDPHHPWVRTQWDVVESPLLTCETVVAEAWFLDRSLVHRGQEKMLEPAGHGALDLSFSLAEGIGIVARFGTKNCDVLCGLVLGPHLRTPPIQARADTRPRLHGPWQALAAADFASAPNLSPPESISEA